MKKFIYLVLLLTLLLPLASCGGKNPFKKLKKIEYGYHMSYTLENLDNRYQNPICNYEVYYEYCVHGTLSLLKGNEFGVDEKIYTYVDDNGKYIYTYDFERGTYNYSFEPNTSDSEDQLNEDYFGNLLNEDNYTYDKKDKVYKIKDTIELGNFYDAIFYVEDDKSILQCNLIIKDGSNSYYYKQTMKFDCINESFNLQLPQI